MKKRTVKVLMIAGLIAVAALAFSGCEALNLKMEIEGTWVSTEFGSKVVIEDDLYKSYMSADATEPGYVYEIVEFDNKGFNGGEEGEGDHGHMVVKYKKAPSWNPDATGHTVIRWKNLKVEGDATQVAMSEGFYDPDGDWVGEYFDTAAKAKEKVTAENDCFGVYTEDFVLQAE
jgi:hypothetical protein